MLKKIKDWIFTILGVIGSITSTVLILGFSIGLVLVILNISVSIANWISGVFGIPSIF